MMIIIIITKKCSSKIYIYVKKGKKAYQCSNDFFHRLYHLMVRDRMKLKIDDIALFMSGFPNLNDLNS